MRTIKTILITGGIGFIGSNFINLLIRERPSWKIVCIDAFTYAANPKTLQNLMRYANFVFYKENICNREGLFSIFEAERPDIVVNIAAETHVDRSISNPRVFFETNVIGVQAVLDACLKYSIERFHQVSTDEVYGDLPLEQPTLLFHEDSPLFPSSPYSASKAAADLLTLAYHRTYDLPVSISRCSNNYGPYQFPEKLIPLMISNAMRDKQLPLYGDGTNIRDWIFVRDHCAGILSAIEKGQNGEIYNFGGNNEKSNIEIVRTILRELDKPESLICYVADRKGHDLRYAIDTSKAKNALEWHPETQFDDGIKQTIKWYITHSDWMRECKNNSYFYRQ